MEAKQKFTYLGQVLNEKKEQIFVQSRTGGIIWHQTSPDYKGRVGQAVIDLGIALRTHNESILNKATRVDDTVKVVRNKSITWTFGQRQYQHHQGSKTE
eukprot:6518781-Heterocapsa_arctica.AAC.1